jgi:superoxide dismutase, Cu-Zn family
MSVTIPYKKYISLSALVVLFGCAQPPPEPAPMPAAPELRKAIAVISPTEGNEVRGTVTFTQGTDGVEVSAVLMGLPAGEHGFHIHQYGDASATDGTSAGGHFNPMNKAHSGPESEERHVGDLGNITADEAGATMHNKRDTHLSLNGPNSILGRGVIIHALADDLTSQPTGAAGARLGIGVIGVAKE